MSLLWLAARLLPGAGYPGAEISNGEIRARMYLPDARTGYYRGTRFDWAGVIYSLRHRGHEYYGPWFDRRDPNVRDFVWEGGKIAAGPSSAITGPVDEFRALGWEEAKAGESFVKIGVGALRKPEEAKYDNFRLYEIADPGKWTITRNADGVEFTQELAVTPAGYGYVYRKTVRLTPGKPEMVLDYRLRNTGRRVIETTVYNHNFLVLDRQPTGPDFVIRVPFPVSTPRQPDGRLAGIEGNEIRYRARLAPREVVAFPVEGYAGEARDHDIRIENTRLGAGVRISGNRPLVRLALWSIRTVIAMEPFIAVSVEPGGEFAWTNRYEYNTLRGQRTGE